MFFINRTCSASREVKHAYKILDGNMKGRDHLGDTDVDAKIMLKWITKK
jgi:hypothetical protein